MRTNKEVQFRPATSQSVCSALPSTDAMAESAAEQIPQAVIQLIARGGPVGGGITKQESEEAINAYYVDSPSDDEEEAATVALIDDMLRDLELLFQEQLTALAEAAAEQQTLRKGKAVVTDPSP